MFKNHSVRLIYHLYLIKTRKLTKRGAKLKAKTIVILIVVALLCTSVASAGFFDWITGQAFSLRNVFQKSAVSKAEVTNTVADNNAAARVSPVGKNTASRSSVNEFSQAVKADELAGLPDNAFWVHIENRLMQADNWIAQFDQSDVSGASRNIANAPATDGDSINKGESRTICEKTVRLVNVGSSNAIIDVNGVAKSISSGSTSTVNGVTISVSSVSMGTSAVLKMECAAANAPTLSKNLVGVKV